MRLTDEVTKSIVESLTKQQDDVIKTAISKYLNSKEWTPDGIAMRVKWETTEGVEGKRLKIDDHVVLELFDPVVVYEASDDNSHTVRAVVNYKTAN